MVFLSKRSAVVISEDFDCVPLMVFLMCWSFGLLLMLLALSLSVNRNAAMINAL